MENALKEFKAVCKMQPKNKDAREKYEETNRLYKVRKMQEALDYADERVEIDVGNIVVEDSYTGPRLKESTDEIDEAWCKHLMQWQKDRKVLHKKFAIMII